MLDRAARFFQSTEQHLTAALGVIASATSFMETNDDKMVGKAKRRLLSLWRFGINDHETHAYRCIPPGRDTGCDHQWKQTRKL